jgi:NTE family protein
MRVFVYSFLFLLVFVLSNSVVAQCIKNLAFEGAGVRGIAYVGSLRYLEENHLLDSVEKISGTSAGAIVALAISLGYTSHEVEKLVYETKIQKFNDGKFFFIGGVRRLNRNYGWYRGKQFDKWLKAIIENKTGNPDITFRQMHERQYKDIYVTGTSLNNQRLIVFSNETYPDMKVSDAVRISMSIPMYFEAVIIDSLGNIIERKDAKPFHDLMVDGGLTGNFPIAVFDSISQGTRIVNRATLGLRIDSPEQIAYDSIAKGLAPVPIGRFKTYVGAFYNYVIENLNRSQLTEEDWLRTLSISSGNIGPKVRKLSVDEKNILISNGYKAMKLHDELRRQK